jgi:endonuclease/exonuclease/phosphatase family metal-dependent hydrolase
MMVRVLSMFVAAAVLAARSTSGAESRAESEALELISWNLHGAPFTGERYEERLTAVAAEIVRRAPDAAMFQEVVLERHARLLDAAMIDYERLDGVPTKLLGWWRVRKGGLVAYRRRSSAWQPHSTGFVEFEAKPSWWKVWERDALDDKGVQKIELRHRGTGARVLVLNTHLQAYGSEYDRIRADQVAEFFATAASAADVAVVGGGDFNLPPAVLAPLVPEGVVELTAEKRRACGCGTFVAASGETGYWVDYLFARVPPCLALRASVDLIRNRRRDDPWSDHNGVAASIRFVPGGDCAADLARQ